MFALDSIVSVDSWCDSSQFSQHDSRLESFCENQATSTMRFLLAIALIFSFVGLSRAALCPLVSTQKNFDVQKV